MITFKAFNEKTSVYLQLQIDAVDIVLINVFEIPDDSEQEFLDAWRSDAMYMKSQKGFINTQLHKAIGNGNLFLNYATWETTEDFRNAFSKEEFKHQLRNYPSSTIASPILLKKIDIKDIN